MVINFLNTILGTTIIVSLINYGILLYTVVVLLDVMSPLVTKGLLDTYYGYVLSGCLKLRYFLFFSNYAKVLDG